MAKLKIGQFELAGRHPDNSPQRSLLNGSDNVHPTQIAQWKRQLLENTPQMFDRGRSGGSTDSESEENLALMRCIDECYLQTSFYNVPRMTLWLNAQMGVSSDEYFSTIT